MPNDLSDLLLMRRRRRGGASGPVFDFYVDSVNGDDGNDGTSRAGALQSLTAASSLLSNGSSLGLARGSVWNSGSEYIDKPSLTGVTIGAYGDGDKPIIDCSDVLSGFVAGAEPNVYKVEGVTLVGSGTHYTHVQWNGQILQGRDSEAACSADPGSFYVTAQSGTVDIYVHALNSEDLTGNYEGEYRYGARERAICLGADSIVSGIETRNNRHNNGSIEVGINSVIERCIVRNGGKHSILAGYGSIVRQNEILEAHNHTESGIMVVVYTGTAPGGSGIHSYIEENVFTLRGLYASVSNQACTYCHTSSGNVDGNLYVRRNTYIDVFGAIDAGAGNISGDYYWDENYITLSEAFETLPYSFGSPYIFGGKYLRGNKIWFPEPWATTFTPSSIFVNAGKTIEFDGNEFYLGPYFTYVLAAFGGAPDITARNNVGSHLGSAFIRVSTATNVLREVSGNRVGGQYPVDVFNATMVIGEIDNNSWIGPPSFRKGGTEYNWPDWVSTTGHDVVSEAGGDNRIANVDRGGAPAGTIRDWPNCWLWINAQDSDSFTEAGGLVTAVADLSGHHRNLVLHEPSPGADTVARSVLDGLPYFVSANNGGLKVPSWDLNARFGIVAAVVRSATVLGASTPIGTVFSGHSVDGYRMYLGPISEIWTDEIVSTWSAGNAGWAYTHPSRSWEANQPHLLICYYDPVSDRCFTRIDGELVGEMTASGPLGLREPTGADKGTPLMLLRGNAATNRLQGGLGELFLGGPMSLDAISDIESEMLARWGIA